MNIREIWPVTAKALNEKPFVLAKINPKHLH